MQFEVHGGQWDYPGRSPWFARLEVEPRHLLIGTAPELEGPPRGAMVWSALRSLALAVLIFLVLYFVFHIMFFWLSFIPLLWEAGAQARRGSKGRHDGEPREYLIPRDQVRNVGGGGSTVAFGLDVPERDREVSVIVHCSGEVEAERLRHELQRPPAV